MDAITEQQEQETRQQLNLQEARKQSIQKCILSLLHACQCRLANCRLPSCQKMKRVVTHTKNCKRKTHDGCPICKQLIALCCYHGKHCKENKCLVPFCPNIKQKLRQQFLAQRLQEQQFNRRRAADMNILMQAMLQPSAAQVTARVADQVAALQRNQNQQLSQEYETATGSKMWHQEIRPEMRKCLEEKLVQVLNQKLMPDFSLSAARKIEEEMFKKANSRSEYFDMIAEEMHKIQNNS